MLDTLIDLHIEWLGGRDALTARRAMTLTGTLSVAGMNGEVAVEMTRDGRYHQRYDLGVIAGSEVVGADDAWVVNQSGQIEPMGRAMRTRRASAIRRSFGEHLLDPTSFERSLLGTEEREDETWTVVRFRAPNGDTYDDFLSPDDGRLVWSRSIEDVDTTYTKNEDWRTVGGVRTPHRESTFHAEPIQDTVTEWASIDAPAEIDPARFARPEAGSLVHWTSGAGEWIDVNLVHKRYLYVPGRINGAETEIVLDSGAGITVVDRSFADEIGLGGGGAIAATGTGGSVEASLASDVTIAIGGAELHGLTVAIVDLSALTERYGVSMPVILGKELFNNVVVDVDYPNARLAFEDADTFAYDGPGHVLALVPDENGLKLVHGSIEGREPALFALDTGSGGTLTIFSHYATENDLLAGRPRISDSISGGVGGTTVQKCSTLRSFTLAGYEMTDVPADFHVEANRGAFDTKDIAGNLGAGILSRFRVIFDYPRGRLLLERSPDARDEPFRRNRTGLLAYPADGALEVLHVQAGSPAEKAGWKAGERIVSVDGRTLGDDAARWRELCNQAPGTEIVIVDGSGTERGLVLADFY